MRAWVYILLCNDGSYYVGSHRGERIEDRVGEHNAGIHRDAYTFLRRPVVLAWCQEFQRVTDSIAVERQLKGWSRAKKEAAIAGRWEILPELSARRKRSQPPSS